jgi:hypothetical protein
MKVVKIDNAKPTELDHIFYCPGCKLDHGFKVKGGSPEWEFNGDFEKPTVSPSILVNKSWPARQCHFFIRDGKFLFLNDCHHEMASSTVEMLDYEET